MSFVYANEREKKAAAVSLISITKALYYLFLLLAEGRSNTTSKHIKCVKQMSTL